MSIGEEAYPLGHLRHFSLSELQSATHNFDKTLIIGEGGFGLVYKGFFDGGDLTAAIKLLNHNSRQGSNEFWTEINMLSKFRHCNLVSLIGYCNGNGEMALVYEYMPGGTLYDHLHNMPTYLSWRQLLNLCVGAAHGLDYLHTGTSPRTIHRDVKSSNILLDENFQAKVSDFGLSKLVGPANQPPSFVATKVKGSIGYLDPEYFSSGILTRKSDVYSFGVVLFEVLCGRRAVDTSLIEEQKNLAKWVKNCIKHGRLDNIINPLIRGVILPDCLKKFVEIALQCLHEHSESRPSMAKVVAELESALALQVGTNSLTNKEMSNDEWINIGAPYVRGSGSSSSRGGGHHQTPTQARGSKSNTLNFSRKLNPSSEEEITGAGSEMEVTGERGFFGLPKDCIAESDSVRENFLPSDYQEIIDTAVNPSSLPQFLSTKQLYLHLSDHPLIIDGSYKSFSLEKRSRKKCYMLAARSLSIEWGETPEYWTWTSLPDARFKEVAELIKVWWLEIEGMISTYLLSHDTNYAAYLVYKLTAHTRGFEFTKYRHDSLPPKAFFGMAGNNSNVRSAVLEPEALRQRRLGQFRGDVINPKERQDGWLEVELGEYYNNNTEEDVELKMGLKEINSDKEKGGLIIQGIEIRPKEAQ